MSVLPIEQLKQIEGPLRWQGLPQARFESVAILDEDEDVVDRIHSRPIKVLTYDRDFYIAIKIEAYNEIFEMDIAGEPVLLYEYSDDLDNGCNSYFITPVIADDEFVYCEIQDLDEDDIKRDVQDFLTHFLGRSIFL